MFSCEICEISKNIIFTEEFQWLLLRFKSCFQRSSGAKTVANVSNKYQIQLKQSICYRENLEAATAGVLQKKVWKVQHGCFPVNIGKFLRTPLKNICERLLLKISTSVLAVFYKDKSRRFCLLETRRNFFFAFCIKSQFYIYR